MKKLKNGCHFFNIDRMEKVQITNPPKVWVSSFLSVNGNGISGSVIMKKLKNGCNFFNINHTEKFQITKPPKVWVSGFPSVDRQGISALAIMKKLKNDCHFFNIDCTEIFKLPTPPKVLWFSECQWKWNISIDHYEKIENDCHFFNIDCMENFQITNAPKFSGFLSVNGNGISASAIMKKLKMTAISLISIVQKNFKLPISPKVWISGFPSVDRNRISVLAIMKKLKNDCHFFNINHMEKFQITDPPKFGSMVFFSSENWRCKFSFFLNFPLTYFSSSSILGSISTFMHGYT